MSDLHPAVIAYLDQTDMHAKTEAKFIATFLKALQEEGLEEGMAFLLARDRLGYMHPDAAWYEE